MYSRRHQVAGSLLSSNRAPSRRGPLRSTCGSVRRGPWRTSAKRLLYPVGLRRLGVVSLDKHPVPGPAHLFCARIPEDSNWDGCSTCSRGGGTATAETAAHLHDHVFPLPPPPMGPDSPSATFRLIDVKEGCTRRSLGSAADRTPPEGSDSLLDESRWLSRTASDRPRSARASKALGIRRSTFFCRSIPGLSSST